MEQHKKRYSVLTFIFNNYEMVREVKVTDPDAEYILVTDDKELKSDTWKIVYDKRLDNMSIIDKCYYVRYHSFEYCNTDICFRIDGSIQVKESLSNIIDEFESRNADMMVMLNPVSTHLHKDYKRWARTRGYSKEDADKSMALINSLGYSRFYKGYYQICVTIERNNKVTRDFNSITYDLLKYLGTDEQIERLDQPIWSFVLNKMFSTRINVMPVSETLITNSKYLQWYFHNTDNPIPMKGKMKKTYLFNKIVECVDFSK